MCTRPVSGGRCRVVFDHTQGRRRRRQRSLQRRDVVAWPAQRPDHEPADSPVTPTRQRRVDRPPRITAYDAYSTLHSFISPRNVIAKKQNKDRT